jgi:hypothetical protein
MHQASSEQAVPVRRFDRLLRIWHPFWKAIWFVGWQIPWFLFWKLPDIGLGILYISSTNFWHGLRGPRRPIVRVCQVIIVVLLASLPFILFMPHLFFA